MATKAYKLRITQLDTPKGQHNTRDITISFVTLVVELHRIIQALYGLKDYHLWQFSDSENIARSARQCIPEDLFEQELIDLISSHSLVCSAYKTLLYQFISRKPKTIYYTYNFGIDSMRKIEYKGLTKLPDNIHWQCDNYMGFRCIEDLPIQEQVELMHIFNTGDQKKLQDEYDYRETWDEFKELIAPTVKDITIDILNQNLKNVKIYNIFLKNN